MADIGMPTDAASPAGVFARRRKIGACRSWQRDVAHRLPHDNVDGDRVRPRVAR